MPTRGNQEVTSVVYRPIGVIHTPFLTIEGMSIQARGALGVPGTVDVLPEFHAALADLEGFSHLILLYHLHRVSTVKLRVIPFLDTMERGVFATRAPVRPNPIGLTVVRLRSVAAGTWRWKTSTSLTGRPCWTSNLTFRTSTASRSTPSAGTPRVDDALRRGDPTIDSVSLSAPIANGGSGCGYEVPTGPPAFG